MSYKLMHIQEHTCIYIIIYSHAKGVLQLNALSEQLGIWLRNPRKKKLMMIVGGAIALLILVLCIVIIMHSHIQNKYANAAEQMQEQAYQNLVSMSQLFSHVDDENVDVQNKLIPALKEQYASAASLNAALLSGYGKRYTVLSEELTQAFDAAFGEYAAAYKEGSATGLAQADMEACIAEIEKMIEKRYTPEKKPEDEIIIIGDEPDEVNRIP